MRLALSLLFASAAVAQESPQLTRAPELLEFVEADYPDSARRERREGAVLLQLTVGVDGGVSDVTVVESAGPDLDAAAVDAVSRFRFTPAEIDGAAAAVRISYRYRFTLEEEVVEPPPTPAPTGTIAGTLRLAGTRAPQVGVRVLLPEIDREVYSDEGGLFEFPDVPAGEQRLRVEDDALGVVETRETVQPGKRTEITLYLDPPGPGDRVVVVGRRPPREVVRRTVTVEEIRTIPGTQGDALKVVQNLPGSARVPPGFDGGRIVLRGGGASLAYLDRHPIPLAFHFGGLRSTVASALIESLDLYPGNFGVEFGRGNGGVVDIRLRAPASDDVHGYAEADVFDAGALVEGPLGADFGSLAVAFRRSYIDGVLALALDEDQLEQFSTAPRYYDAQILHQIDLSGGHELRTLLYGSSDRIILLSDAASGGLVAEWVGGQLRWTSRAGGGLRNEASVSYLVSSEELSYNEDFRQDLTWHRLLLREDVAWEPTDTLELRGGLDAQLLVGRLELRSAATTFTRDGELPPDGPPRANDAELVALSEDLLWASPALYFEATWALGPVELVPGLRAEWFGSTGDLALQPRLTSRYTPWGGTTFKAGVGLFAEQLPPIDLATKLGNPDLMVERSLHTSVGVEQRLTDALKIDLTGYYKVFEDLVTRSDDPAERLVNQGTGRAWGLEVLLRHDATQRLYGWVAYTLQRSVRTDRPGGEERLFDLDQTHNLVVVAQYRFDSRWEAGLRWRFVSGNPYTPVAGTVLDIDENTYARIPGEPNSRRVAPFHSLDLRVDKHWVFDTWRLTTYLEVQNAYNRENVRGVGYNYDYTQEVEQLDLPIIPSFGIRGSW